MTVSQFQSGKRQRTRRGVSLIEVLVVLVILVVGILTIIRLFPSGFFSIQSTGNAALANSLGGAAINLGEQDAQSLPEAILPGIDLLPTTTAVAAMYSNYDPDNPNNLENARIVSNETVTVPSLVRNQSIYVVKYGPVVMPGNPTASVAGYPNYFTINSPYWKAQAGNSAPAAVVSSGSNPAPATDIPQDTLVPGHEQFVVDLANQKIALPYASYTETDNTTTPPIYTSYDQRMVVVIQGSDGNSYVQYLDVKAATTRDSTNPYAPKDSNNPQGYLPDTTGSYQGGWFYPTGKDPMGNAAAISYPDPNVATPQQPLPSGVTWVSVSLYRPYKGVVTGHDFNARDANNNPYQADNDPYQFELAAGNIGGVNKANPGVVSLNPKAAIGSGAQARKAQISYIVYRWDILHEDHDIPALTGSGSTFAVRTTVPNLLLAGSANPDNTINSGIAGSSNSLLILDLDTGKVVAPGGVADPTNPDSPINNEDLNGTNTSPSLINVSYSLGRLTFGSDAFGDNNNNSPTIGAGTAPAHRIRIFYTADLNWTVAVQKAPAYFSQPAQAGAVTGTTPLGADQFAYDATARAVYFARCNAGKTVEIDGTYTTTGATPTTQGFSDTVAVSQVLSSVGDSDVSVDLTDGTRFQYPVPSGATVVFGAVRGLSARSVVAWKERNVYKVHSVDTILNRTP